MPAYVGSTVLCRDRRHNSRHVCAREFVARQTSEPFVQKLSANYKLALLSGDNEPDRERFWNLFGNDRAMHFNQTPLDN